MTEIVRLEREARTRLAEFRDAVGGHPPTSARSWGRCSSGPLKFRADGNRFLIEGDVPVSGTFRRYA
jgi:hypothetical protein